MFHSEVIFDNARSGRPLAPADDMTLRLRYEVDNPRRLARHVHLVDGAGYFFFPGGGVTGGPAARLLVDFTSTDQTALLEGRVWAPPAGGGPGPEASGEGSAGDLASRLAVRRMVLIAQQQWEGARTLSHPRSCRCTRQDSALPEVLLLG